MAAEDESVWVSPDGEVMLAHGKFWHMRPLADRIIDVMPTRKTPMEALIEKHRAGIVAGIWGRRRTES